MTLSHTSSLFRTAALMRRNGVTGVFLALVISVAGSAAAQPLDISDRHILDEWQEHLEKIDRPPFPISASTVDPQTGDTWLATWGSGLVRYSAGRFDVFNQFNSGVAGDLVFDVAVANGRIVAATIGGISAFAPTTESWSVYFPRRQTDTRNVWVHLSVREGTLYATSAIGEVQRYEAENDQWVDSGTVDPPRRGSGLLATKHIRRPRSARSALAIYGPRNRTIQLPGSPSQRAGDPARCDLAAVEIAVSMFGKTQKDRRSGIELVKVSSGYARYGWTLPEDDVVLFALNHRVGAVVGHLSPRLQPTLAEVVGRTGIGFVSTASLDVADQQALFTNPYAFRCYGAEKWGHRMLFDDLLPPDTPGRIAIVRSGAAFDDLHVGWWRDYAQRRGVEIVWEGVWRVECADIKALGKARPDVIVTWSDAESTVAIVDKVRGIGLKCPIVVSPACVRDDIGSLIDAPLGSLVSLDPLWDARAALLPRVEAEFQRAYTMQRFVATTSEHHTLDSFHGADHALYAIAKAGGNQPLVVQVLREMRDSAYGEEHFAQQHSPPVVSVARYEDGLWVRFKLQAK